MLACLCQHLLMLVEVCVCVYEFKVWGWQWFSIFFLALLTQCNFLLLNLRKELYFSEIKLKSSSVIQLSGFSVSII